MSKHDVVSQRGHLCVSKAMIRGPRIVGFRGSIRDPGRTLADPLIPGDCLARRSLASFPGRAGQVANPPWSPLAGSLATACTRSCTQDRPVPH